MPTAADPPTLRPYQREALEEVAARWDAGHRRTWIVLPPGAGKTLVGLEAARRLGRRTVVLVPNTAIQGQWIRAWDSLRPEGDDRTAGTDRDLSHHTTVLTYQTLAVFDPDAETDEEGGGRGPVRDRLHPNGRALVGALHDAGPLTVLLDECHHLLQVWGRLLAEVLDDLPDARVVGLTGTPATDLTAAERALVDRLFGAPVTGASIPALVRDGYLAPFAELAYLTEPTPTELAYLKDQGERFSRMCGELLTPGFATTDLLPWIDARFVHRDTAEGGRLPWSRVAAAEPALSDAVLRLHHAGLCALPEGARPSEEHRRPPTAADWIALVDDYAKRCLPPDTGSERDREARERLRAALPAIGHHLTRNGVRRGVSPVDRVLARSDSKAHATAEILAAEHTALGERLRALVLCDHERASSRPPAALRGILDADAGSARLQLATLAGDPRTGPLDPVLLTGRTVAMAPGTAVLFLEHVRAELPGTDLAAVDRPDGLCDIEGPWSPRVRVAAVTRFFEAGGSRALVGTRALLGEGWDARGVNTVVDLTTATTPTAVVQSRGRALRLDPAWPDKTAHTWTVVCVSGDHPRGDADWDRFVRKHQGYLGADADGEVMSGVAHIDPSLSPYAPPDDPDGLNRRMLARVGRRDLTRGRWRVGEPYEDSLLPTLRVRRPHTAGPRGEDLALPHPPRLLPAPRGVSGHGPPPRRIPAAAVVAAVLAVLLAAAALLSPWTLPAAVAAAALVPVAVRVRGAARLRHARSVLAGADAPDDVLRHACAVADALRGIGRSETGARGVRVHVDTDGVYRFTLPDAADDFAAALEELVGPVVGEPSHLVPRPLPPAVTDENACALLAGAPPENPVVYHVVPSLFGRGRARLRAFTRAWGRWIAPTEPVPTATGTGPALLAAHYGAHPLEDTSTARRLTWS
ncbi:Helicase conserved C-terminal domain-containing protein [Nocardiopsis flavescens]|uniref:Helicase conserved C-terminal domain-containing protein n=1 Tax=Nocardiopsis flavescens TaxID=758803 RepID=A0A1M6LR39_9ACTN|nr:DEAD/DEAH box helicase family protein [Nocardiopsis flavescens]SHJ73698.1 Helicase conserved C-terminal domain-containing protein [Nocardiopsis flavescens]